MIIGGTVKKAELIKLGNWNESMMIITLDVSGKEFSFPIETSVMPSIEIDKFIKFDLSTKIDGESKAPQLFESDFPEINIEVKEPVSTEKEKPDLSDDEIKSLYGIKESPTGVVLTPKIDTRPDQVSHEEFRQVQAESLHDQKEVEHEKEEKSTISEKTTQLINEEKNETPPSESSSKGMSSNFMDFMSNGFIPPKASSEDDDEEENE